jgi:hypothetical protein
MNVDQSLHRIFGYDLESSAVVTAGVKTSHFFFVAFSARGW